MGDPNQYDDEAMARTLRLTFTGKKPTNLGQVVDVMKKWVPVDDIEAVYRCGEAAEWYMAFTDSSIVKGLGDGVPLQGNECRVTCHRLDTRKVLFKIHWYPLHMKLEYVQEFFERYGDNVQLTCEVTTYDGVQMKTGAIFGTMITTDAMFHSIPYKAMINYRPVMVTVKGRLTQCLKCNQLGHTRATCPNQNPAAGARSYADAARGDEGDQENGGEVNPPARQARQGEEAEKGDDGPPARQAREGAEKEKEKDGPPARQAREGAEEKEKDGPPARQAREGADSEVDNGPPAGQAREGAPELTEEEMDLETARMENERKRKGTDDSEDDEEEVLKKTKEEVDIEYHNPLDPSMILDLTK